MLVRRINYSNESYESSINIEAILSDEVKIPEQAINKALMIAMNYLIENIETDKEESAE